MHWDIWEGKLCALGHLEGRLAQEDHLGEESSTHWDHLGGETLHNGIPCRGEALDDGTSERGDSECWNTPEGKSLRTRKPRSGAHISCPFPPLGTAFWPL